MTAPVLSASKLTKQFGGLTAVNDVSLSLFADQVHALIGTNGAGKSTLTHLLCGELKPTSGSIRYAGQELAGMSPHRIAQLGIGRSYQRTTIFPPFTVFENVRLAAQSRQPRFWQVWRKADEFAAVNQAAEQALQAVGLSEDRHRLAESLSHGAQRQLEIAMCLATNPKVLLLDEPLAGMGAFESTQLIELIRALKPGRAILLIEHDMDAVFAVADWLTVMVNGRVIESGLPETVRSSAAVQEAYLGEAGASSDV